MSSCGKCKTKVHYVLPRSPHRSMIIVDPEPVSAGPGVVWARSNNGLLLESTPKAANPYRKHECSEEKP